AEAHKNHHAAEPAHESDRQKHGKQQKDPIKCLNPGVILRDEREQAEIAARRYLQKAFQSHEPVNSVPVITENSGRTPELRFDQLMLVKGRRVNRLSSHHRDMTQESKMNVAWTVHHLKGPAPWMRKLVLA